MVLAGGVRGRSDCFWLWTFSSSLPDGCAAVFAVGEHCPRGCRRQRSLFVDGQRCINAGQRPPVEIDPGTGTPALFAKRCFRLVQFQLRERPQLDQVLSFLLVASCPQVVRATSKTVEVVRAGRQDEVMCADPVWREVRHAYET